MKINFKIRKAEIDDAKGIHEVLLSAFEEYRHFYTPEGFDDTVMSEIGVKHRLNEMTLYVSIDPHGKINGTIGWQKTSEKEGHIRGMAVLPKIQGKNSPALALLEIVEKDARSNGCKILSLDTTYVLKRAQSFYKKNGFKETGKTGDFFGSTIYEFAKEI